MEAVRKHYFNSLNLVGNFHPEQLRLFTFNTYTYMYVYLIKCSIYYKIGFSKNPNNRLKTVKTHNPLDVKLFATLKTDRYNEVEKELHNLFANKNSRREWFELHQEDLLTLKIDYGFNFLIPINSIKDSDVKNSHVLNEIKEIRIDNSKIDYFKSYFEELFEVNIISNKNIKKCCIKFDTDIIKESIDNLYDQGNDGDKSYKLLYKVCSNILESKENPGKYFCKVVKAILYKQYNASINENDIDYINNNYNIDVDVNEAIKDINSKKFYLSFDGFWDLINNKYLK